VLLGTVVSERRSGRRRARKALARWQVERRTAEAALAEAVGRDAELRRHAWPDPGAVAATALGPGPRLWERRPDDADAMTVRLATADQEAHVTVDGTAPPAATTLHAPLVCSLMEVGVLGVSGPGAADLGRWLVVQLAVAQRPADLSIVLLGAGWEWARWLPHTRASEAQRCSALLGVDPDQAAARVAELQATVSGRAEDAGVPRPPVLLALGDLPATVPGLDALLEQGPAHGVYAVCVSERGHLPPSCRAVATLLDADLALRRPGVPTVRGALADAMGSRGRGRRASPRTAARW